MEHFRGSPRPVFLREIGHLRKKTSIAAEQVHASSTSPHHQVLFILKPPSQKTHEGHKTRLPADRGHRMKSIPGSNIWVRKSKNRPGHHFRQEGFVLRIPNSDQKACEEFYHPKKSKNHPKITIVPGALLPLPRLISPVSSFWWPWGEKNLAPARGPQDVSKNATKLERNNGLWRKNCECDVVRVKNPIAPIIDHFLAELKDQAANTNPHNIRHLQQGYAKCNSCWHNTPNSWGT